ncbi:hypothetical protein [Synechococcus sp. PCC 6312]|uniref:hypothetical protein n=1 Tax=Synechococcus sp. (strain ATCC 27167 / PCC 6312) TaxID=195253 RepID=UPI0012E9DE32|nr:hypothetical protein [Synechococcus sp. PCC 6312]
MSRNRSSEFKTFVSGVISSWDILGATSDLESIRYKPLRRRYRERSLRSVMGRDLRNAHISSLSKKRNSNTVVTEPAASH